MKNGEVPQSGPLQEEGNDEENTANDENENNAGDENNEAAAPFTPPSDDVSEERPVNPPPTVEEVLNNPDTLPSPPVDEEKPGGFEPFVPPAQPHPVYTPVVPAADIQITPDQMLTAQKYCKYASSALNYDDVNTAIENLQKALKLLTTGQDS